MKQLSLPELISCSDHVLPAFHSMCFMHRIMLFKWFRSMESGGCVFRQHSSAVIIKCCYLLYIMIRHQSLWLGCALHGFSQHFLPAELCCISLVPVIRFCVRVVQKGSVSYYASVSVCKDFTVGWSYLGMHAIIKWACMYMQGRCRCICVCLHGEAP